MVDPQYPKKGRRTEHQGNMMQDDQPESKVKWKKQIVGRGFRFPHGIAVKGNYVFVSDQNNNQIKKVDPKDNTTIVVAGTGSILRVALQAATETTFNFNGGIAFDSKGQLFIVDSWNNAIKILSADEKTVTVFLESNVQHNSQSIPLRCPRSLALDKTQKYLIVANTDAGEILKVDVTTKICVGRLEIGGQSFATGLAFDKNNTLYFTNSKAVLTVDAGFQTTSPFLTSLSTPIGLLFDPAGNLWIAEESCLTKYNTTTKQPSTRIVMDWPMCMALDSTQNLIVSEYNAHRVWRIIIRSLLPWNYRRWIWVGLMKNRPSECFFAALPKEIIHEIIGFLWEYYE